LDDLQFIVPNPMSARRGPTKTRKISAHALSITGERRFLIVEFDFDASRSPEEARLLTKLRKEGRDERDLCAALLLHLAEIAPSSWLFIAVANPCMAGSIAMARPSKR
jgi:hypothetical protein